MDLSLWRDITLIIWGSVATVSIVFIAVILFLFYQKTSALLESSDLMIARARGIMDYVDHELIRPVSRVGFIAQGVIQGISVFSNMFKKKENRDE